MKFNEDKQCYYCGTTYNLHLHHIFEGNANRKVSDRNGFVVYLCMEHHRWVHHNPTKAIKLKQDCERWYLEQGHTIEEFIKLIGKNFI